MPITLRPYGAGLASGSGSADVALPGTAESVPGGVDSVLEYNGVYLNDRTSADRIRVRHIDGFADADVRYAAEANPASHGETPYDSYYGGRTIVITGRVEAHELHKLRDMQQALRQIFGDLRDHPLYIHPAKGGRASFIVCRKNQPITMAEEQAGPSFFRDFMVSLRASNPRFLSLDRPFVQGTIGPAVEAVNQGNFPAEPTITVNGDVTDFTLTNNTTGEALVLTGNIPLGQQRIIDVEAGTIKDQAGANRFDAISIESDWPELVHGANSLVATASASSGASWTVAWRNTWM